MVSASIWDLRHKYSHVFAHGERRNAGGSCCFPLGPASWRKYVCQWRCISATFKLFCTCMQAQKNLWIYSFFASKTSWQWTKVQMAQFFFFFFCICAIKRNSRNKERELCRLLLSIQGTWLFESNSFIMYMFVFICFQTKVFLLFCVEDLLQCVQHFWGIFYL